jgi:PAS domain S-box-containing protein
LRPDAESDPFSALFEQTMARGVEERGAGIEEPGLMPDEAESLLASLAGFYRQGSPGIIGAPAGAPAIADEADADARVPIFEARYRTLLEQISAIVFMAYLDRGVGEAYVGPQIEAKLGFSQQEWLEDPIRWYQQIHPDDKQRWSREAATMIFSGAPLRSVYRVLTRTGQTVWFHCEARIVRHADRRPWFIQGVAFDITDLKQTESALQDERNVLSAILDTVGALVVVLSRDGRIVRFNRACEKTTERAFDEVRGHHLWDLFMIPEETDEFKTRLAALAAGDASADYETWWKTPMGLRRISWSSTILTRPDGAAEYVIATGIDITERRRLQKTILEISDQEQRRIGQDLHDGLGQHLTGIAFMSKVLEQKLIDRAIPESGEAAKIVGLVNEAITKTRELARGLLLLVPDDQGLVSALKQIASDVEDLFGGVSCRVDCGETAPAVDVHTATHLCNIVREAVNNAIKHGRARQIAINLTTQGGAGALTVRNNGSPFTGVSPTVAGMGLQIMRYRASMIGGTLEIESREGGTTITCRFPVKDTETKH